MTTIEEKSRKRKRSAITEEDVSTLLLRYSVKTVLTLLHDVAKVAGEKIDWNVKNTTSGIPSAGECRMLWRHLAYGESLTDQFDNPANPMDDDSDLEHEMEAIPAVNREASVEAAAYVKVLIASNYPIDSHVPNNWTIEAPLTINIPKLKVPSDRSYLVSAMQGTNVIIPVSVEKEKLPSGTCEKKPKDGKSGVDCAPQRKRRVWSTEDDAKLTAAVQKHGEQNWANVASEDFSNDRKASELSQRWANIRKKKGNLNAGNSSELSEARKAASRAILIALEPDNLKAASKSRVQAVRPSTNCTTSRNPMVQAAAVAAGACVATPAGASSAIQALARSPNVVHIRTGVSSSISIPKQLPTSTYISHNGPTNTAISTYSTALPSLRHGEAQIAKGDSIKPAECAVRPSARVLDVSSGTSKATTAPLPNIEVAKTVSVGEMKKVAERDRGAVELISEHQTSAIGNALGGETRGDQGSV